MATVRLFPTTLWTAQSVAANGSTESPVIDCLTRQPDILMFKVATTLLIEPNVKLEVAFSNDGVNFNFYTSQDPLITDSASVFSASTVQDYHALTCPSAPYLKLKVTDISGFDDNCLVSATLWMRDPGGA
jgi:hypothetical protein